MALTEKTVLHPQLAVPQRMAPAVLVGLKNLLVYVLLCLFVCWFNCNECLILSSTLVLLSWREVVRKSGQNTIPISGTIPMAQFINQNREKKQYFYKKLHSKGISKVKHIMKDHDKFLPLLAVTFLDSYLQSGPAFLQ